MHFNLKVGNLLESIIKICKILEKKPVKNFNPWAFVQKWSNKNGHPSAILDSLIAIAGNDIRNAWAYGNKIMSVQSGNYYESEHIEQAEQFKEDWDKSAELKDLLTSIGTKI